MSKPEKVILNVADSEILRDLSVPALMREHRKWHEKQKAAESQAAEHENEKKKVGAQIENIIEFVAADSLEYERGGKHWLATLVKGEPGKELNEERLKDNLIKVAKLDGDMVNRLFEMSQDPTPARKSYVLVTVQEQKQAAN